MRKILTADFVDDADLNQDILEIRFIRCASPANQTNELKSVHRANQTSSM
jgi:hypothetical protein